MGTSTLARHYAIMPSATETVVVAARPRASSAAELLYYALQLSTFADSRPRAANTAFADFPTPVEHSGCAIGYMPRQFAARGDRLAFSNGIVALAVVAALLIWRVSAATRARSFRSTRSACSSASRLSQAGMVDAPGSDARQPGWQRRAALNGIGAVATALVSIVQVVTKFTHGAWIVVLIIPLIIAVLRRIHRHYSVLRSRGRVHGSVAADVSSITP